MNQKQFLQSGNYLINEVKNRADKGSPHFFDHDTIKFFSSRISDLCWQIGEKIYFITSEADKNARYNHSGVKRAWTVRIIDKNGDIQTLGKFQENSSLSEARKEIKQVFENSKIRYCKQCKKDLTNNCSFFNDICNNCTTEVL